jgi:hypothetical protein
MAVSGADDFKKAIIKAASQEEHHSGDYDLHRDYGR